MILKMDPNCKCKHGSKTRGKKWGYKELSLPNWIEMTTLIRRSELASLLPKKAIILATTGWTIIVE
jgi:hypothetical protein